MSRDAWRPVLAEEVRRWSARPFDELSAALADTVVYTVERDGRTYQVEVLALERTEDSMHVMLSVDDGSLPLSLLPVCDSFIVNRRRE